MCSAIDAMGRLSALTALDLSRRALREEQLSALAARLPGLRTLTVFGCLVSEEALRALERRHPSLRVHDRDIPKDGLVDCAHAPGFLWLGQPEFQT